jgi:hypothetical protein
MKNIYLNYLFLIFLLPFPECLSGQDSSNQKSIFPEGISLEYGFGNYSVKDEYISEENYSGALPDYMITWSKAHQDYVYHLSIGFQSSSEIKNYNVSTDIYRFVLNQGFSYSLPEFKLFGNEVYSYLGPSTELFFYYNEQNIAVSGFDYAQSYAMLISAGVCSQIFYKLVNKLNIEGSLQFSVLSLGFRIVDTEESDEKPVKILTLFSGTNLVFGLGPRYYLFNNLSLKAAYLFHLTRISAWEPLLSAGDNLIFTFTYGF